MFVFVANGLGFWTSGVIQPLALSQIINLIMLLHIFLMCSMAYYFCCLLTSILVFSMLPIVGKCIQRFERKKLQYFININPAPAIKMAQSTPSLISITKAHDSLSLIHISSLAFTFFHGHSLKEEENENPISFTRIWLVCEVVLHCKLVFI